MHWVEALTKQGLPKVDAQAQSMAAQIWAEILGMVCHPEYYKLGRSTLHHTTPANLLYADSRLAFLKDFIAVVRCLADGGAPIGHLRRDAGKIHRRGEESEGEEVLRPSQKSLDEREVWEWRKEKAADYAW